MQQAASPHPYICPGCDFIRPVNLTRSLHPVNFQFGLLLRPPGRIIPLHNGCSFHFSERKTFLNGNLMDLKNPKWMYLKAALFIFIGVFCFVLVLLDNCSLRTAFLLALMAWAFCRAYYFAFYVIEKYIDGKYRFSGLISFFQYLCQQWRSNRRH